MTGLRNGLGSSWQISSGRTAMATPWVERRLSAILAADVVGYSHLVEQDEAGTLSALKDLRCEVIEPLLAVHHGRIVK
jgi:adenylate cyclase